MSPVRNHPRQERGRVERVGVAGEHLGPEAEDLAILAGGHLAAVVVDQADLVAGGQPAVGAGPLVERVAAYRW